MNLLIQDGRAELWQWDTGVRLVMDEACEAVNLSEDTFGVTVDVTAAEDGKTWVAAVPDKMLQKPGDLICYAVQSTATGTITAAYRSFRVNRRPKPAGYVATPTEARTWQELNDKKIDAPQVAQVGEVLTVDEVDADGKPKKWKTAAVDVADVVKFTKQDLTDEEQAQARKNIRAKQIDFPVTITSTTTDGVTTYTADKTFAEIKAAYESGANVYVNSYNNLSFLSQISEDYVVFGGIVPDYCGIVEINSENIITMSDYYLYALNYFNDVVISDNGNLFVEKDYEFVTMTVPVPNADVKDGAVLKCMASGLEWIEDTSLPSPPVPQVGQIVKVKSVDESGKITETETVDMPTQKTLKWVTVHSSDLTESKRELIISTDTDGKSIADYNPVGLTLIISTPADATQTDNNGAPWVYPSATKEDNTIRAIGSIAGWKTTARDSVFAFYGGSSAMTCTGNVNIQLATYKIDGYALDGVTAILTGNTNHFPVGTHVEVAILCEMPATNVMPA